MKSEMKYGIIGGIIGFVFASLVWYVSAPTLLANKDIQTAIGYEPIVLSDVEQLVYDHARAWETGDIELLTSTMHPDIVFAYPGRRLNFDEVVTDLRDFKENFTDTKIYIEHILVDEDMVAVEWQFAATGVADGKRTVVSDGIIGKIKDGKIVSWKEYLDGRVSRMQKVDALPLEEGEEPFPSPEGSLRNFCEAISQN